MNKLEVAIKGLLKPFIKRLKKNKPKANSTKYCWGTASSSMGGAISTAIFDGYEWHVQSMPY